MVTYNVVDADGHVLEPPDLWQRYIDPAFRYQAPYMADLDGMDVIYMGGKEYGSTNGGFNRTGATGSRNGARQYPANMRYLDGAKGGFDPHARIEELDGEGIDAVFLYPSVTLACGLVEDAALAGAICRAYNRYIVDYCHPYPDRLFGVAALPMQSVEAAVEELCYAADVLGLRHAFIRPNPYMGRLLSNLEFDQLWTAAQDRDMSIGLHEGTGGMPAASQGRVPPGAPVGVGNHNAGAHIASHTIEMMLASLNLIWGGVCDRYPDLRFAFLESGGGWMAGWLDRMDRHFDQIFRTDGPKTRPTEIFARQCWISFEPVENSLPHLIEFLGPTKLLWATDFPHRDSFTGAPKMMMDLVPEQYRQAVLAQGAIDFYKLGAL